MTPGVTSGTDQDDPLGHHVVADLLAFHEGAHPGALDRTDVHEHVLAAVGRLDKTKAFLGIEELHGTCGHRGLLEFVRSANPITRTSCVGSSEFWGAKLSTLTRERSKAGRKLVAAAI